MKVFVLMIPFRFVAPLVQSTDLEEGAMCWLSIYASIIEF